MGPLVDGGYSAQALVAPWPAVAASDTCGWAVQRRLEGWAWAQALWLGHAAISNRARGTTALVAATLWVVVARIQ
eukprot:4454853-Alexandrium_andersonii.AAC.1